MTIPGNKIPDDVTVAEARDQLREIARGEGGECPVCKRQTKVRRRNLTSVAARAVAALYKHHGTHYAHMPTIVLAHLADVANQGGYATLGQYWGLIEEETVTRPDGGRAGYWHVTARGEQWLQGEITVSKYVDIYNARRLGEPYGDPVTAAGVLKTHFDLIPLRAPAGGAFPPDALFEAEAA